MSYPISITTYNRELHLYRLVNQLEVEFQDVSIFDDNPDSIVSAAYYDIHRSKTNLGSFRNTIRAIDYNYNTFNTKYMINLQDDIQLSKNWYNEAVRIMNMAMSENENFGILSLYNRKWRTDGTYHIMPSGHPGGVAWIINRDFWKVFRESKFNDQTAHLKGNDKRQEHFVKHLADWKICHSAHELGWKVGYVSKSLVQHVGDKSSISDRDMSFCRSDNYVG